MYSNFKHTIACSVAAIGLVVPGLVLAAENAEGPKFQKGLWQFERTVHLTANPNIVLVKSEMTRCVDPSMSMKEAFRPVSVGNCHSKTPIQVANKYVFPLRCDYMGPVRTTIEVESDAAYTEVNELSVGRIPRTDTVIARRISDCD